MVPDRHQLGTSHTEWLARAAGQEGVSEWAHTRALCRTAGGVVGSSCVLGDVQDVSKKGLDSPARDWLYSIGPFLAVWPGFRA